MTELSNLVRLNSLTQLEQAIDRLELQVSGNLARDISKVEYDVRLAHQYYQTLTEYLNSFDKPNNLRLGEEVEAWFAHWLLKQEEYREINQYLTELKGIVTGEYPGAFSNIAALVRCCHCSIKDINKLIAAYVYG